MGQNKWKIGYKTRLPLYGAIVLCCGVCMFLSCSTQHNTASTRAWHAFTAHFNTLYNGEVAFNEGMEAQQRGHQDDYSRLLPMYISTQASTANLGKSNFETAITKSEKAIKLHSIKKKPVLSGSKRLTPEEKEYRARKEFNPYLRHAWMMLGKAQFQQGNFIEAASTFSYITRLYSTQPEVNSVAKAWLARCYVALDWPYDAEDILHKMRRDSMSIEGVRERENTQTAFLIATQQYAEAIPHLRNVLKHSKGKLNRTRLNYLMAQLYHETGDNTAAYKYLSKVIRSNPPYELEFNARIMQTEVMPQSKYRQLIKQLQRMARSERNQDYLDRVYYAIGNIYLGAKDTTHCLYAWETGVEKSTQNGIAKAVLLLRMGQVYWEVEKYIEAQKAYQQCIGLLDKNHEAYKESEERSKILDVLAPHLSDVKLQDSLQRLARMDEKGRMAAIDRVIEALKKKEKEESKRAGMEGAEGGTNARNTAGTSSQRTSNTLSSSRNTQGAWYFYNPITVQNGKQEFQRRWGNRPNEDNWQRGNKENNANADTEAYNYDEPEDTLDTSTDTPLSEEDQALRDSLANDPHEREFYLKQIPFSEEQLAASNELLSKGLYEAGVIEMERVGNFPLARKTLQRLLTEFPDFARKDDILYHLFLLAGRMGDEAEAEAYRQQLIDGYPQSRTALLLSNPHYIQIASQGKHMEDSLYMATYRAYTENRYNEVKENYAYSSENFPEGANRPKLLFVHAMTLLYTGDHKGFQQELKALIEKYPKEDVTAMAQYIVKGLQDGRLLASDKYNATDIWGRRTTGLMDGDSTAMQDSLSVERFSQFNFVLAYPTNSLDEDQLLYEMARYNFSSYMVRNFDIERQTLEGISMLCVKGFQSYDEVHAYAQQLYQDVHMRTLLEGIKSLLISEKNLQLLGKQYSFDDYGIFFEQKLAPITLPENIPLDEQTDIPFIDPDEADVPTKSQPTEEETTEEEDDFPYGF